MFSRTTRLLELIEQKLLVDPRRFGTLLVLTCLTAAVGQWVRYPINHDVGSIVDATSRLYDGERLYVDMVDFNLPVIYWVCYPAIFLSRLTGMPETSASNLWFLTIIVFSIMLAWRVAERVLTPSELGVRRIFVLGLVWVLLPYSAYHFGQREHLAVAGLLPYLLAAAGRATGARLPVGLSLPTGLLAAAAFGLKPFFVPLWLMVEAYLYVVGKDTRAWKRTESLAVAMFLVMCAGWVAFFTPYLAIVGLVKDVYGAYEAPIEVVWEAGNPGFWLVAGLFYLLVVLRGADIHLRRLMLAALCLFSYSAMVQMKGWPYHWHPTRSLAWLCIMLALASLAAHGKSLAFALRFTSARATVILALVVAGATPLDTWRAISQPDLFSAQLVRTLSKEIAEVKPGAKIMWLSSDVYPMFPSINYAGGRSIMRAFLFVLPNAYKDTPRLNGGPFPYHVPEDMKPYERMALEWVVADFEKGKPDIIVVDRRMNKQGFGLTSFDFEEYFNRDARFVAMMARYEKVSDGLWRTYRRKGL